MRSTLYAGLETLQNDLLMKLENVSSEELTGDESKDFNYEALVDLVYQMEVEIQTLIIKLNKLYHNEMNVVFKKSYRIDTCDEIKIERKKSVENWNEELIDSVDKLIYFVGWFFEFNKDFNSLIRVKAEQKFNQVDEDELEDEEDIDVDEEHGKKHKNKKIAFEFPNKEESTKKKLLMTTKKITKNLINGNHILQSGILQSNLNLDEITLQTQTLKLVNEKNSNFDNIFKSTKNLVKALENSSNQEKKNVYMAIFFLIACICWVLWRRIFKLPTKIFFWFLFKFFKSILLTIGLISSTFPKRDNQLMASSTTTATTTMASLASTIATTDASTNIDSSSSSDSLTEEINATLDSIIDMTTADVYESSEEEQQPQEEEYIVDRDNDNTQDTNLATEESDSVATPSGEVYDESIQQEEEYSSPSEVIDTKTETPSEVNTQQGDQHVKHLVDEALDRIMDEL